MIGLANNMQVVAIVKNALQEDVWTGDITTEAVVNLTVQGSGEILFKESGVLAGLEVAELVFRFVDPFLVFVALKKDGDLVESRQVVATVNGCAASILVAERVALNFLQRLSGIATRTRKLSDDIRFYNAKLVDTRKTTPGLRILEKYAVRVGGGFNHRFGLYDAVLIKDNHIVAAGSIYNAVTAVRNKLGHTVKIEVEAETMEQVAQALEIGVDIIMLDNMTPEHMRMAVKNIAGRATTEASGRITEENIVEVAKTGVDYISMGALTHSTRALDISLDLVVGEN